MSLSYGELACQKKYANLKPEKPQRTATMIYVTPTIFPGEPGVKKYWIAGGGAAAPGWGYLRLSGAPPNHQNPRSWAIFYVASRGGGACQVAGLIRG